MSTKTIDLKAKQIHSEEILSLVREGAEIIFTDANTPLARLIPLTKPMGPRIAGLHPGAISTSEDFDKPLPDEFWTGSK